MRKTYIWDPETRSFVELEKRRPAELHNVINDTIDRTWSPADGQYYDSKSSMRREARARGFIDIGNESTAQIAKNKPELAGQGLKQDLLAAYEKHRK